MHLIDDVELIPAVRRCVFDVLDDNLPDFIDLGVRSGIELEHIERVAGGNLFARVANPTRRDRWSVNAVQRFRQDSRGRRFSGATRADKNVGMRQAVLLDGILERAGDVILSDDFVERLGPVFSGKNRVAHRTRLSAPPERCRVTRASQIQTIGHRQSKIGNLLCAPA